MKQLIWPLSFNRDETQQGLVLQNVAYRLISAFDRHVGSSLHAIRRSHEYCNASQMFEKATMLAFDVHQ